MSERRKLLLADDSVTIQKVVNLTFADEGIDVVAVGDGDAAMEKFAELAPDLMMVDVNMPGTDGYRICEMVKQNEQTAHIPVILLVGSFEPFDEERAYSAGADGYLTKPFQSIRQLVGKVTSLLDSNAGDFVRKTDFNNAAASAAGGESARAFQNYEFENTDSEIRVAASSNLHNETGENFVAYETARFDDTDDETIQTNQIGSLPADEAQRFSADFSGEDYAPVPVEEQSENSFDYKIEEVEEDRMETQPLSVEEEEEENFSADSYSSENAAPTGENVYEFADAQNVSSADSDGEQSGDAEPDAAFAATPTQNFSWDFDEMDLLELSFQGNPALSPQATQTDVIQSNETDQAAEEKPIQAALDLSPEIIEQIAARVVEQLAERVMRQITRDIVPQVSDLIIKELAAQRENAREENN